MFSSTNYESELRYRRQEMQRDLTRRRQAAEARKARHARSR